MPEVDDIDIEKGQVRYRQNGSAGTHNGMRSIVENLKSTEFARLKIGISNNKNMDTKNYVLGKFTKAEMEILNPIIQKTLAILLPRSCQFYILFFCCKGTQHFS